MSTVGLFSPSPLPPLRREVYDLTASPTHIQRCEGIVRAAMKKTADDQHGVSDIQELSLVGATGTAFKHTTDLHVKKLRDP